MLREDFESIEAQHLSPLASQSARSRGRLHAEPPSPTRTDFQRDRDRVVHSKAFRRLKHKTQVFVAIESDHYRSRLTHTLEVAQISRHIARALRLNEDLSECIALAHDLGHTPFGHAGERELNRLMADSGGFEHNLQSLRVVDVLESKYPNFPGLNLTEEVRVGLLKHETPYDVCGQQSPYVFLEPQVVNSADEIAYNNHDLDDGLQAGLLSEADLDAHVTLWREAKAAVKAQYSQLTDRELRHLVNSHLIGALIQDVVKTTTQNLKTAGIESLADLQKEPRSFVEFGLENREKNQELRAYLFDHFYMHYTVYRINKKGQFVIRGLFNAFNEDPMVLPLEYQGRILAGTAQKQRVIADYIAGMTDGYAQREYHSIYS